MARITPGHLQKGEAKVVPESHGLWVTDDSKIFYVTKALSLAEGENVAPKLSEQCSVAPFDCQ